MPFSVTGVYVVAFCLSVCWGRAWGWVLDSADHRGQVVPSCRGGVAGQPLGCFGHLSSICSKWFLCYRTILLVYGCASIELWMHLGGNARHKRLV